MIIFRLGQIFKPNLKHSCVSKCLRHYGDLKLSSYKNTIFEENDENVVDLLRRWAPNLVYNSEIEKRRLLRYDQKTNSKILRAIKLEEAAIKQRLSSLPPIPISLKYLSEGANDSLETVDQNESEEETLVTEEKLNLHFPYQENYEIDSLEHKTESRDGRGKLIEDVAVDAAEEVKRRQNLMKDLKNWMTAYDNYDDNQRNEVDDDSVDGIQDWQVNYGTPDPTCAVSNVPCGGCGALLHCKDTAIPGYIPSEIFKNSYEKGSANLEAISCQRCYFLKHYNIALQTQVSPSDYPKILVSVKERTGVVILIVDLLDFPCSIWPGIADILGNKIPVIVVGNKVDLLPQDSKRFLKNIENVLLENVKLAGFATLNINHVALISAKTGYGIEDLITYLNGLYRVKGDVYIVGCTNVGKSSLFNALIQSDYCKIQAIDLIQRATTSVWPGTTLNLLKFPIKRPAGLRQFLRHKRLLEAKHIFSQQQLLRKEQLKQTNDPRFATLIGHIDITKNPFQDADEIQDSFSVQGHANESGKLKMGINEKSLEFAYSKWCFDTPGVVQPDQIIHLLTTDELIMTLPKQLIIPKTFCIKPGMTVFIAGLSRLDYLEGSDSVRITVFCSNELPITICQLENADEVYKNLLGTVLMKVPVGDLDRLSKWPGLEAAKEFTITGRHWNESASDIVLSNSGWIALTGRTGLEYKFQAWTPEKRGIYLRGSILPYAVARRGTRIKHSVAYKRHRFFSE